MTRTTFVRRSTAAALMALVVVAQTAYAQSRVQYGRITAVRQTTVDDNSGRNVGRLVGGGIGLASGSGQSGSNRALRTVGGAAVGGRVGDRVTRTQAFEYTVLIGGTNTIRIVSEQAGKRVGDCVSVEQGQFANIRLVSDARCSPPPRPAAAPAPAPARPPAPRPAAAPAPVAPAPTPAPTPVPASEAAPAPAVDPADQRAANACDLVKLQVLEATTDEEFNVAERRMRLLCGE
jgi:outer membrane lipoprotein SlyB